jgi:hypothetical protein
MVCYTFFLKQKRYRAANTKLNHPVYPGNSEKLYEKWGQLSENILKEAKKKNMIDLFSGSGGMYSYSSQNCLLT